MKTNELLRRYVDDRSEPAFEELVKQHVDLVYSAALRQVNGNVSVAQDVTQAVFTDLARKAPCLTQHTWLPGWLYTSTRYLAAKAIRAEQCRRSYEQEAHEMNQILQSPDSGTNWLELRPLLDTAMHDLSAADREAVLMRYFERLSLAEIGARLGLKANAANMRIERAVDRLRAALAKRGVTSTLSALGAVLTARAVEIAPAGTATRASANALATAAGTGGISWALLKLAGLVKGNALVAAGAAVLVAALIVVPKWLSTGASVISAAPSLSAQTNTTTPTLAATVQPAAHAVSSSNGQATDGITLLIVADDTGKPVPNAGVEYIERNKGEPKTLMPPPLTASEEGKCVVPFSRDETGMLIINSRTDGYADISAEWMPDSGEKIPQQYTLRLGHSIPIGGQVQDENGQPVAGAEVQFVVNVISTVPYETPHLFTQAKEKAVTDADGHWHLDRFDSAAITTIDLWPTHPDYFTEPLIRLNVSTGGNPEAAKQLLAGNHVLKLTRGIATRGVIVDTRGHPVPGAKVTAIAEIERAPLMPVPSLGQSVILQRVDRIETTNYADGTFVLTGCRPGTNQFDVEARGFALASLKLNLTNDPGQLHFVLQPGHILRLRLVDAYGTPVTNGGVYLASQESGRSGPPPMVGTTRRPGFGAGPGFGGNSLVLAQPRVFRPDAEGRVVWESAPEAEVPLFFQATGLEPTNLLVAADGEEHQVVLISARPTPPPLTVTANVHDAASGQPIAHFIVATGFLDTGLHFGGWGGVDNFQGGKFLYTDRRGSRQSMPVMRFKFAAEGYAPFVTRDVGPEEGNIQLDIALSPRPSTSVAVLLPDGQPATNADIGLEMPGPRLTLIPGGLKHNVRGNYTNVFSTDENGRFALPPDDEITRVVAVASGGYVETTPAALLMEPVLRLQPWGQIAGTEISGGKPAAGRELALGISDTNGTAISAITAETDADGRFNFSKVPPGQFTLWQRETQGERRIYDHCWVPPVQVRSGETAVVSANFYTVTVRLSRPPSVTMPANSSVRVLATQPQLGADKRMSASLNQTSDGSWITEDLPAGDYTLSASVVDMATVKNSIVLGIPITTLMRASVSFTIPANPPSGVLDLGEIVLQPLQ